jgi:hypothetical protein
VVFGASVGVVAAGGVIVGFALVSESLAFWAIAVALARATVAAAARKNVRMGSTPLGLRSPETRMRWESSRREVQTSLRGLLRNRRSTLELKAKAESELRSGMESLKPEEAAVLALLRSRLAKEAEASRRQRVRAA